MGVGRYVCVALPFGLTFASLVCILIVMLAGITHKSLDMFDIKTQDLSVSSSSLANLIDITKRSPVPGDSLSALTTAGLSPNAADNITASALGLADSYKVYLWNYCAITGESKNCTKAEFDWAATSLNTSTVESKASALTGKTVRLPSELRSALKSFKTFSKWTQVVYILAFFTCVAELFLGLFGFCSRAGSCLTFIISGLSTITIFIASLMATLQSAVVIAAVKSSTRSYGVQGSFNTSYITTTWLAAAFSIGAGVFWMATICCCAADHSGNSKRKSRGADDQEKLIPTVAYQRMSDPNNFNAGQQHDIYNPQQSTEYGVPMQDVKPVAKGGNSAYEPYSHTAI